MSSATASVSAPEDPGSVTGAPELPTTVVSYPYAWLPVVLVFSVLATITVPIFALVWLVLFVAVALAAVLALGWGLVAAVRAVGRRLW
jgi:hypothetical protein